jgi:hypothetical protein
LRPATAPYGDAPEAASPRSDERPGGHGLPRGGLRARGTRAQHLHRRVPPAAVDRSVLVLNALLGLGTALGPALYGWLIGDGSSRTGLFIGYLVGAAIMILGGIVELLLGINAEGKSLEDVTKPLTAADEAA